MALANLGLVYRAFPFVSHLPGTDRTAHAILMGGLSFLVSLQTCRLARRLISKELARGVLAVGAVVTFEECAQLFLAERGFDPVDLLADYTGILAMGVLASWFAVRCPRRSGTPVELRPPGLGTGEHT